MQIYVLKTEQEVLPADRFKKERLRRFSPGFLSIFEEMRKYNLIIAGLAFLMVLISVYFGSSIHNAKENMLIEHLNEMDHLDYYDVRSVPTLSRVAGIMTVPFATAILVLELIIVFRSGIRPVKNIAIGLSVAALILIILDILTIGNSTFFDFSQWGYFWVLFGITMIAGNMLSVFIPGNKEVAQSPK